MQMAAGRGAACRAFFSRVTPRILSLSPCLSPFVDLLSLMLGFFRFLFFFCSGFAHLVLLHTYLRVNYAACCPASSAVLTLFCLFIPRLTFPCPSFSMSEAEVVAAVACVAASMSAPLPAR